MKSKNRLLSLLVIALVIVGLLSAPTASFAQAETVYDLINMVNALRASQGLAPYQIDPAIMAYAQEHSDYQAAIQQSTHEHSDGNVSLTIGLYENVAGGDHGYVTMDVVVYEIWADPVHMKTMTGFSTGFIGAGLAVDINNTMYITLNVRPGENATTPVVQYTAAPIVFPPTNTPGLDGTIWHVVRDGDTLWGIATMYGITVQEIRNLNGIPVDSTLIYTGQKLLIKRNALSMQTTAEVTGDATASGSQPADSIATVTPTHTPALEIVQPTSNGTATQTQIAPLPATIQKTLPTDRTSPRKAIGIGLIIVSGVLLLIFALNYSEVFNRVRGRKK